jgi:transcription initiation factor TFIID subunit 2
MFYPEDALLLTLKYPSYWAVTRAPSPTVVNGDRSQKKRCIVTFSLHYRTQPKKPLAPPALPPPPALEEIRPPEPKKIKLQSKPSFSGPSSAARTSLPPMVQTPSISVSLPKVPSDSISVLPSIRPPSAAISPSLHPPPSSLTVEQPVPNGAKSAEKKAKPLKKRKSDEGETNDRPRKLAKTESGSSQRRRVVTVKFNKWKVLRESTFDAIQHENEARAAAESTIVATPVKRAPPPPPETSSSPTIDGSPRPAPRTALPGHPGANGNGKPRKPLPTGAPSAQPPAAARVPSPSVPPGGAPAKPRMVIKLKVAKKEPQA